MGEGMLEITVIIALTMGIVQVLKNQWIKNWSVEEETRAVAIYFLVILVAGILNVLNAVVFGNGVDLQAALKLGILEGAASSGIYSWITNYIEKRAATPT